MNWKQRIELIVDAGQSIDSIAREMGVTANAVREILKGRTSSPRADAAIKLLALFERLSCGNPAPLIGDVRRQASAKQQAPTAQGQDSA